MMALAPTDHLDASLQDFEQPSSPHPAHGAHHHHFQSPPPPPQARGGLTGMGMGMGQSELGLCSRPTSEPATTEEGLSGSESVSTGGYSPPAWRRLGNGDRSSGFWRRADNLLGAPLGFIQGQGSSTSSKAPLPPMDSPYLDDVEYDSDIVRHGIGIGYDDYDGDYDDDDIDEIEIGGLGDHAEDDAALQRAIRTRLPTGSLSPEKEMSPDPDFTHATTIKVEPREDEGGLGGDFDHGVVGGGRGRNLDVRGNNNMPAFRMSGAQQYHQQHQQPQRDVSDNYIRFAVRAEVQQRTEPIENAIAFVRTKYTSATRTWSRTFLSILTALLAVAATRFVFGPASPRPVPDLVKVAGIARAFEPMIYYSENGAQQVGDLQATGVAVWDLGESVRSSNLTSAPIIVRELDELSDSLKTLAIELTKFFANVDGDIDGILIVMDWARRELTQLQTRHQSSSSSATSLISQPLSSAFDNIHNLLSAAGILEDSSTGLPTRAGAIATSIFGMSYPQRTRATLQRTFTEFLSVLEEAITSELSHSLALFALFESVDRQFLNLARTVAREASAQDDAHADLLSSLWTRLLGPDEGRVKKYERNRVLLKDVRERTVRNKGVLLDHNQRLLQLKANLESLRRKLVSPLVRSVNSSTLSVEEQIRGLEDVSGHLDGVRARQKARLMEVLYGGFGRRGGGAGAEMGTVGGGSQQAAGDSRHMINE